MAIEEGMEVVVGVMGAIGMTVDDTMAVETAEATVEAEALAVEIEAETDAVALVDEPRAGMVVVAAQEAVETEIARLQRGRDPLRP